MVQPLRRRLDLQIHYFQKSPEELAIDNIAFSNPLYKHMIELASQQHAHVAQQVSSLRQELLPKVQDQINEIIEQIRLENGDITDKQRKEAEARENITEQMEEELQTFESNFLVLRPPFFVCR